MDGDMQTIRESLEALGADDRELLTLIAWEGLTGVEAAGVLGIRPATARKRLERARRRLQTELATRGFSAGSAARNRMDVDPMRCAPLSADAVVSSLAGQPARLLMAANLSGSCGNGRTVL